MVPARPWGRGRRSWLPAFSAVRARRRGQAADGDSTGRPRKHWSRGAADRAQQAAVRLDSPRVQRNRDDDVRGGFLSSTSSAAFSTCGSTMNLFWGGDDVGERGCSAVICKTSSEGALPQAASSSVGMIVGVCGSVRGRDSREARQRPGQGGGRADGGRRKRPPRKAACARSGGGGSRDQNMGSGGEPGTPRVPHWQLKLEARSRAPPGRRTLRRRLSGSRVEARRIRREPRLQSETSDRPV